jgi:hypothetical protein
MFEQLDEPEKKPRVSGAMTLGILAAFLIGVVGTLFLFIFIGDRPFGTQIATVIVYTYFAFLYVFFPTRWLEETYSLRDKAVQQQFPRLTAIHCGFLTFIFLGQTVLFAMKPRLPSYWLTPHGKQSDTLYGALILVPAIVLTTQVFISRRILSRSVKRRSEISQTDMPSSMDKL